MTRLKWGQAGQKRYESGLDHGVLYLRDNTGAYNEGHAWNGLTGFTESPSGAESSKQYADNGVYLNLKSAEEFGGTLEAFTYPDAFGRCDGSAEPVPGVSIGQQERETFGFAYRTKIGNDVAGMDAGFKIHIVYGADAAPSEKARTTINDSPEASTFSWELTTTPVEVGVVNGKEYKPTAHLEINSLEVGAAQLTALEDILYGTAGADPRLPLPGEVFALVGGSATEVETVAPTYDPATDTITIPTVAGVVYTVNGEPVSGGVTITEDTVVNAHPADGYSFTETSDTDWTINYS